MHVIIIVAYSKNRVIGCNGRLPWHLPNDLAFFKKMTMNSPIIMGRKTWENFKKPLKGRINIIVNHNYKFRNYHRDLFFVSSLREAFSICNKNFQVFIIGGEQIYRQCISMTQTIFATEIHAEVVGDTFFPELNTNEWYEIAREPKTESGYRYDFVQYSRYIDLSKTFRIKSAQI